MWVYLNHANVPLLFAAMVLRALRYCSRQSLVMCTCESQLWLLPKIIVPKEREWQSCELCGERIAASHSATCGAYHCLITRTQSWNYMLTFCSCCKCGLAHSCTLTALFQVRFWRDQQQGYWHIQRTQCQHDGTQVAQQKQWQPICGLPK